MRLAGTAGVAVLVLCAAAWTADTPAQKLFDTARDKVLNHVAKVPRYTCVETITRTIHHPQYGLRRGGCAEMSAARKQMNSKGLLMWRDRLRVDVAVAESREMFSWAGAGAFDTNDLSKLIGTGATGSGAFGTFMTSVFGHDGEQFRYMGESAGLAMFEYAVPLARSHYTYRMNNGSERIIAYRGSFAVNALTGDLKQLVVRATEFPQGEVCEVEDTMDYATVKIGQGEFLLPEVSRMVILNNGGQLSENETRFSKCREYVGESTLRFDEDGDTPAAVVAAKAALKSLPGGTKVRVYLDQPVDSNMAAAGDAVVGIVDREVKEKGQVLVRTSDRLHGRILRMEQTLTPIPRWVVMIRFDSIERDGLVEPVNFLPMDDGDRSPRAGPAYMRNVALPKGGEGVGVFAFIAERLVLDRKFRSEWQVAKR